MSAYATQISELDHKNLVEECLRQKDSKDAAEARERAKDEALREDTPLMETLAEHVHNAWWTEKERQGKADTHPDAIPYEQLSEDVKEYDRVTVRTVLSALRAALAQQPADQPEDGPPVPDSVWQAVDELNRASTNTATADQPAREGEQERFERVTKQVVYSIADFCSLEIPDAAARSIAREILQAADQPAQGECLDPHTLERAAQVAEWAHMVPPDGGSPSKEEREVAEEAARRIRNLRNGDD